MSFSDLKKQSKLGSLTAKLVKEVEKMNSSSSSSDDRLWKLDVDKSGNGYAVIRFLPAPDGEDLPFVKLYSHAFQGPGGWYIENSLTTLGQKDPVSELNSELWNNGTDAGKEIARKQKRKLTYINNIYVVKDPANPADPLLGWAHGSNQQTFLVCNFVASSQSATNLPYFEFIVDQHTNNSGNVNQDFDITINNERSQSLLGLPIGTTRCIGFGQDLPTARQTRINTAWRNQIR